MTLEEFKNRKGELSDEEYEEMVEVILYQTLYDAEKYGVKIFSFAYPDPNPNYKVWQYLKNKIMWVKGLEEKELEEMK